VNPLVGKVWPLRLALVDEKAAIKDRIDLLNELLTVTGVAGNLGIELIVVTGSEG